ncbi:MAG: hypothetical protein IIC10_08710 [Proteobacteria bacterium]|nr:hypothetical protein [Pseudomonadota bacterium]
MPDEIDMLEDAAFENQISAMGDDQPALIKFVAWQQYRTGKVLVIDTGISAYYGGHMASLLIEGDKLTALQNGVARPVPLGEEPLLPYFRSIAEQESMPAALQNLIDSLSLAPQLSN